MNCSDPEHKSLRGKNGFSSEDDEAVVFVTYQDAVAFCDWLTRKEGKLIVCLPKLNGNMRVRQVVTGTSIWMTSFLPPGQKNQVITATLKPLSLRVAQTPPNDLGSI